MNVKDTLTEFYKKHKLEMDGGTHRNWNTFKIGYFNFTFPSLNKEGYLLHDVNHILCGYGVDWFSEFETSAWEIGSGGRKGFGLSWFYPLLGAILGLLTIPKRTISAFTSGLTRKNAHVLSKDYEILEMDFQKLIEISHQPALNPKKE